MSKQIGLIKVKGNLDGVSFYQSNGENVVRMAKGPDKNRILTDPAFKRTRENNREFAGSATAAKAFRSSLGAMLSVADKRFTSRTLKVFKSVNSKALGLRGQRPIEVSKYGSQIAGLELNINRPFSAAFKSDYVATHNPERNSATVKFENFIPAKSVPQPGSATHFKLIMTMGTVSDFTLDKESARYEPLETVFSTLKATASTELLPISQLENVSVELSAVLPGNPVLPASVSVVQTVGIEFYLQLGGEIEPASSLDTAKVVAVF